ncbi:MAG TPA: RNA 2',3'-cyclic phosphodiesterase [Gaiellaceae bacterium]
MTNERARTGSVERDGHIRLFCGLQLADDTLDCLTDWQTVNLAAGRIVPRENLHITLAFLGDRPSGDVTAVAGALQAASAEAGELDLAVRGYRETRSVGMVTLEDRGGAATRLAEGLQSRLEGVGVFRREGRAWLPHITVLRFRERAGLHREAPNMCSINAVRAALYRSLLGSGGASYEVLESVVLGGR